MVYELHLPYNRIVLTSVKAIAILEKFSTTEAYRYFCDNDIRYWLTAKTQSGILSAEIWRGHYCIRFRASDEQFIWMKMSGWAVNEMENRESNGIKEQIWKFINPIPHVWKMHIPTIPVTRPSTTDHEDY